MPRTVLVFYREPRGEVPVLNWLGELRKRNRAAYQTCVAGIDRLAALGRELRRPLADLLRDGIDRCPRCKRAFESDRERHTYSEDDGVNHGKD